MPRFNLPPAPPRALAAVPYNLGEIDPSYTGWYVVVNPAIPLGINEILLLMDKDSGATEAAKLQAMEQFVATAFLEWNFVKPDGAPMRQPTEGGAKDLDYGLLPLLGQAFANAIKPADPILPQ